MRRFLHECVGLVLGSIIFGALTGLIVACAFFTFRFITGV